MAITSFSQANGQRYENHQVPCCRAAMDTYATAVKLTEHEWLYVFRVASPLAGASSALLAPRIHTTNYMKHHLRFMCEPAGLDVLRVLLLGQAGWHVAWTLQLSENVRLLHLPARSLELCPK